MEKLLLLSSILIHLTSCKTSGSLAKSNDQFFAKDVESISCNVQNKTDQSTDILIFPKSQWQLYWSTNNKANQQTTSGNLFLEHDMLNSRRMTFKINDTSYSLAIDSVPQLTFNSKTINCTQFFTNTEVKEKAPSCNSIGTSAQGWYKDGKLITYSKSCHNESLSCASNSNEGWYVQKKQTQVEIAKESCSWMKETPTCETNKGITGWFLNERLVSRDDSCRLKSIECSKNNTSEGWVTFSKMAPSLFVLSPCTQAVKKPTKVSKNTSN